MKKSRIIWIDAVKFTAIIMVVLAHVLWLYEQNGMIMHSLSIEFRTCNRIISCLGVPLFMMVSGALLFRKQFKTKTDILSFYKRGLFPLFLTAEIWILIYCLVTLKPFSWKELMLCMTFIHKPEVHLWYVRLIIMYYLALPFINGLREKENNLFACLVVAIGGLTFAYNGWLIVNGDICPTSVSRSYFCYLVYMTLGYWLSHTSTTRMKTVGSLGLLIAASIVLYWSLLNNEYFLWYDNSLIFVIAICLFYLLRICFARVDERKWIVEISNMSYGIYLSHFILIYAVGFIIAHFDLNVFVFYFIQLSVFIIDIIFVRLIKSCSPKISKWLFRY